MTERRRFSADFKARVAVDALCGDKTNLELKKSPILKANEPGYFLGVKT